MDGVLGPALTLEAEGDLRASLREIPHFPVAGILFKDLAPLLSRPGALTQAAASLEPLLSELEADALLAVDARGFILGAALADRLRCGFVMVRKPGKLPGEVQAFDYSCEYCDGQLEVSAGAVRQGLRYLVVDDLLATGGTARATADFVRRQGGAVVGFAFMLEIEALQGRAQLTDAPVFSVMRC
jgi:adenine phosphoribosyltransferase